MVNRRRVGPAPTRSLLVRAGLEHRPLLRRLLELYQHDLSRIDGRTPDDRGAYGYRYLDLYWKEPGRYAYLLRVDGKWAGFALVNKWSPRAGADWSVAEFFILPPFRRRGLGERLARAVLERHRGTWHVAQMRSNREAIAFWRKVVDRFTGGRYQDLAVRNEDWDGRVQVFVSKSTKTKRVTT